MEKEKNAKQSICPVAKKCSGCQLRNMTYEEQLRFKQIKVDRLMGKLCRPDRIIAADSPAGPVPIITISYRSISPFFLTVNYPQTPKLFFK